MIQKLNSFRVVSLCLLVFTLFSGSVFQIYAQSQALNGQIEGVVTDATGAAIPNVWCVKELL